MRSKAFIAGVALILGAVVALYFVILVPTPVPSPSEHGVAQPITPRAERSATLTDLSGQVEIRAAGEAWLPLNAGDAVANGVDLRTGRDGRASVRYGEDVSFEILPDTELGVRQDGDLLRLVVSEGVAIADVRPESETRVQLTNARGDAFAEVRDGTVGVLVDERGALDAAVTRGRATVSGGGETRELEEGFRTTVQPGATPAVPTRLPRSFLLKVQWPEPATSEKRQLVTGTTNPGARVRVGAATVRADEEGRFKAVIELREGINTIGVFALDAAGRNQQASSPEIELDTRAPTATVETDPSMWD